MKSRVKLQEGRTLLDPWSCWLNKHLQGIQLTLFSIRALGISHTAIFSLARLPWKRGQGHWHWNLPQHMKLQCKVVIPSYLWAVCGQSHAILILNSRRHGVSLTYTRRHPLHAYWRALTTKTRFKYLPSGGEMPDVQCTGTSLQSWFCEILTGKMISESQVFWGILRYCQEFRGLDTASWLVRGSASVSWIFIQEE